MCSDLLEGSLVAHNGLRIALDDKRADEVLAVWGALEVLPRKSLNDIRAEVTAAALALTAPGKDAPSLAERAPAAASSVTSAVDDEEKKEEEDAVAEAAAAHVEPADDEGFESRSGPEESNFAGGDDDAKTHEPERQRGSSSCQTVPALQQVVLRPSNDSSRRRGSPRQVSTS